MWFLAVATVVIYVIYRNLSNSTGTPTSEHLSMDERYNYEKAQKQKEIDALLDKINKKGMEGLSEQEKQRLDELTGG